MTPACYLLPCLLSKLSSCLSQRSRRRQGARRRITSQKGPSQVCPPSQPLYSGSPAFLLQLQLPQKSHFSCCLPLTVFIPSLETSRCFYFCSCVPERGECWLQLQRGEAGGSMVGLKEVTGPVAQSRSPWQTCDVINTNCHIWASTGSRS